MPRQQDLKRFYKLMDQLECNIGGRRALEECERESLPCGGGVYFFFEDGENRTGSGCGRRIVQVGKCESFRRRIYDEHRRSDEPRNPLRGSVFRKWVSNALYHRCFENRRRWPSISSIGKFRKLQRELTCRQQWKVEHRLNDHMSQMTFLCLPIKWESWRRYVECNAIALLSEYKRKPIDSPSDEWLGSHCDRRRVRESGLWQVLDVNEIHDPDFLDILKKFVDRASDCR